MNEKVDPQLRKVTGEIAKAARKPMLFFADLSTDLPATKNIEEKTASQPKKKPLLNFTGNTPEVTPDPPPIKEADFDMAAEVTKLEKDLRAIMRTRPAQRYVTVKAIERFLDSRLLQEIKSHCVAQAPTRLDPQTAIDLRRVRELSRDRSAANVTFYGLRWQRSGGQLVYADSLPIGELVLSCRSEFELLHATGEPFTVTCYRSPIGTTSMSGPDLWQLLHLSLGLLQDHADAQSREAQAQREQLRQQAVNMTRSTEYLERFKPQRATQPAKPKKPSKS